MGSGKALIVPESREDPLILTPAKVPTMTKVARARVVAKGGAFMVQGGVATQSAGLVGPGFAQAGI